MRTAATVIDEALSISVDRAFEALDSLGGDHGDCGGAWVVIPAQKGRKELLEQLAALAIPMQPHHEGGIAVTILKNLRCQSRLPREKGCQAFCNVLEQAGYQAYVYSYAD